MQDLDNGISVKQRVTLLDNATTVISTHGQALQSVERITQLCCEACVIFIIVIIIQFSFKLSLGRDLSIYSVTSRE